MKKYLYLALALPMMFACSSDDLIEKGVVSNDQYAGIQKVDATFSMDEGQRTRFDGVNEDPIWDGQEGDTWGFAWLTDEYTAHAPILAIDGNAYQNHNLIQTKGVFKPQTAIYVGKYFLYRPYDKTTVSPQQINFKSLENQTIAEGYESKKQPWRDLAKTAINLGDKWTEVTPTGTTISGTTWNQAGTEGHYDIYGALFSNQTGLDMTYKNNDVDFDGTKKIAGATDIEFTPKKGTKVGAADIYSGTVELEDASKSFTYGPTNVNQEPVVAANVPLLKHNGTFWADKSGNSTYAVAAANGFNFTTGAIALNAITEKDKDGIQTEGEKSGWIWFNSLPVYTGLGATTNTVQTILTTSYGVVTINETVGTCAYVLDKYNAAATSKEWIKLAAADDNTVTPKTWNLAGAHNTFINQYGNHKGKFALTVNFADGVMNGMDIVDDNHLQKALKYYIASGKTESPIVLNLQAASATDATFRLSKISIALLQTINGGGKDVKVNPGALKIIVTQDRQDEWDLVGAKEVPTLDNVFSAATDVYLAKECEWTWSGSTTGANAYKLPLSVDAKVTSINNEGTLTVNATNVETSGYASILRNAKGATMNITKVTTLKNDYSNFGILNIGSESNTKAELRAYNSNLYNNATGLKDAEGGEPAEYGIINNYGVIGSSQGTTGKVRNYGHIYMMNNDAITLLFSNQTNTYPKPFGTKFIKGSNMMGTVILPKNNPTAIVSVSGADANGFIKYTLPAGTTTYATPAGNVKYNTIIVSEDITFNAVEDEIQFIEFNTNRKQVVNPAAANLPNLKGVIVNDNSSIIIEKGNVLNCSDGAFLGKDATVYKGGTFAYPAGATTNYLGTWNEENQIVKW